MTLFAEERPKLIDFELEDQFDTVHKRSDYQDKLIVIVGSDKEGSEYNPLWVLPLADSLRAVDLEKYVEFVGVADLGSVPFFMRGIVQGFFPDDSTNLILMDWDGAFAEKYKFKEDHSNIAVFDIDDRLVANFAVQTFNEPVYREILNSIKQVAQKKKTF